MGKQTPVSVRLDATLKRRARRVAVEKDVNLSDYIRDAVQAAVERDEAAQRAA